MCLEESWLWTGRVYRLKLPLFISPSPLAFLSPSSTFSNLEEKEEKKTLLTL